VRVYTDVQAFYGLFDISAEGNTFEPSADIRTVEFAQFDTAHVKRDPGLFDFTATLSGIMRYHDTPAPGKVGKSLWDDVGQKKALTIYPDRNPAVEGDDALVVAPIQGMPMAPIRQGDLAEFSIHPSGDNPIGLGICLANGTKSSTSNGTGVQHGSVPAEGKILAHLHCPSLVTSLDVTIESDDNSGFTTATTRFTFTQLTAAGWQAMILIPAAGITDDWWRATWTPVGGDADLSVSMAFT
jgi:hypothetical protein